MAGIAICQNSNYIKKDLCERFQNKQGEVMKFKNICTKENNYKWFWQNKNKIKKENKK